MFRNINDNANIKTLCILILGLETCKPKHVSLNMITAYGFTLKIESIAIGLYSE